VFARWFPAFSKRSKPRRKALPLLAPPPRIEAFSRPDPKVVGLLEDPCATPEQRLSACRHLVRFGRIGQAVTAVSAMLEDPALRDEAREILQQIRIVRKMGLDPDLRLADAAEAPAVPATPARKSGGKGKAGKNGRTEAFDPDRGYWVVPTDSDTTLIAFTGRAMRLDISIYFMQRLLSRFGVNVIYVFDWADAYYYGGVTGLGTNLRQTTRSLRALCRQLGSKRVICFGQSTGGYAAIRYGVELRADGVLSFSPVILPVARRRMLDHIARKTGVRLQRQEADLRAFLERAARVPLTRVVYGDGNRHDVRSARHLSGLPNVVEQVLPGVTTHGTVEETTLAGTFPGIFRDFCREVGARPGRIVKPKRAPSGRRPRASRALAAPRSPAAADSPR
jgi:pimeloyl-ACP methyl ester carboxylesterase